MTVPDDPGSHRSRQQVNRRSNAFGELSGEQYVGGALAGSRAQWRAMDPRAQRINGGFVGGGKCT